MTTATADVHAPSRACYLRGCQQPACRDKHLRYCKQYQFSRARTGRHTTDAAPYIIKVQAFVAAGWTHRAISETTGVGITTIRDLAAGEAHRIYISNARRLDRHQPTTNAPTWWVDATGTMRRIQALTVIGWPQESIAAALGLGYSTIRRIANDGRRHTPRATAEAVAALYADWSRRPGPSRSAAGRARARGWHGPLAWDSNIDDPNAIPDTEGVGTEAAGRRDNDRPAEIRHLAGFGLSADTIAKQVGLNVKDVKTRLGKLRTQGAAA
jgi:DNA-directed RNA polymerase specialized sigma24 family protein